MGIPVAVQHLVKDNEVFKDASLQLGTWRGCCCAGMLLRCFHFSSVCIMFFLLGEVATSCDLGSSS